MRPHKREEEAVRDLYDIRDTDLELLPFTVIKWHCILPGCTCGTMVRDYGIAPHYYSPRKGWGWVDGATWWMLCSKHWKHKDRILRSIEHRMTAEYMLSKFGPAENKKKSSVSV